MNYTLKNFRLPAILFAMPLFAACGGGGGGGGGDTGPVVPPPQTLTVVVSGVGTVASSTPGITNCSATGGTCTASFASGSNVQLIATPGASQSFRGWAGACTPSNTATCTILMDRPRQEVAVFESAVASGLGDTFALTGSGKLLSFDRATPGTVTLNTAITGLTAGDTPVAIDFRPSNSLLYVLTKAADNKGRLYLVDEPTAAATLVAQISENLVGSGFSMDFDPTLDLLRVVSDSGQNLLITPSSGAAAATTIATRIITGVAFTNAFKATQNTVSYVLDSVSDQLYTAVLTGATPTFTLIANLGDPSPVDVPAANGFDIDAINGAAYVAYNVSASSPVLRTINLSTGAVGAAASIGAANETILGLALPTPPEPQIFAICQLKANENINDKACTDGKTLVRFQASTPGAYSVIADLAIGTEKIVAMDTKPSTGELYGLSDANKLYTINPVTGAVVQKSTVTPALPNFVRIYGFDFDPLTENIRIIGGSATGNADNATNISVNPDTGVATALTPPQKAPFKITNIAYTNNNSGATSTVLHGIDSQNDRLFTIDAGTTPANNPGRVTFVANLGFDASELGGFETISPGQPPASNLAYATRTDGSNSFLYSLNLSTGTATQVDTGAIGSLSGFTGPVIGLTAQVNQGASTKFYAATTDAAPNARLLAFSAGTPGGSNAPPLPRTLTNNDFITGMVTGETVLALEFRFANNANTLFLLARGAGNVGRLYTVNTTTGVASAVGTGNIMTQPPSVPAAYVLEGTHYGMDVEPTSNNIRIVSDLNENLVVNPTTAAVQVVADLAQTPIPSISAAAYTQNYAGSLAPTLLLFDANGLTNDRIMTINDSTGIVTSFGPSTIANAVSDEVSFDIAGGHNGLAFATEVNCPDTDALCVTSAFSVLYSVNLTTGVGTAYGSVGTDNSQSQNPEDDRIQIRAMAIRLVAN